MVGEIGPDDLTNPQVVQGFVGMGTVSAKLGPALPST